jgi:tRNA-2-methylthio-N6-dimethylallyladenosine synthase
MLMPHLHLPVQSGSDRMLAAMNRNHTRAEYLALIARLRKIRPDMAFTSDFIIGFPGESEEDFRDTLAMINEVGYASAFFFKYSARPGTPAAEYGDQIEDDVKTERLARLKEAVEHHQTAFNKSCLDRTFAVLFEKEGRLPGQIVGRSPYVQPVHVMAPSSIIGEVADVMITRLGTNSLFGELKHPAFPVRAATPELATMET